MVDLAQQENNMEIRHYPDGTSYAVIPESVDKANEESYFTYRINSYEDLWHLGQLLEAFNHKGISPHVTIPNLIDAQADRRFGTMDNQSSGLKMVCKFLNQFDALYSIYHPHNPEVVEASLDNVILLDNSGFVTDVLYSLGKSYPTLLEDKLSQTKQGHYFDSRVTENTILMSSDAGGFKPLMKLCDKLGWEGETYSASKSRDPKTGKLTQFIGETDFKGKNILIVDDICVYGGTFKGLAKLLKERNCGKLYLAVSHMTIQDLGEDPVTNYFDVVFTTNSKYTDYWSMDGGGRFPDNLAILKHF